MSQGFFLDKARILERLGDDEEIFAALADLYLQDVEAYCGQLGAALAAADNAVLGREAHTVKGLLATFADDDGAALAFALEGQARAGAAPAALAAAVAAVQARLRLVGEALRTA